MEKQYIENVIEHIDDQIEYGLLRAHNTMGGMTPTVHNTFIIKENKFVKEELIYTPALIKAPCEIIDNAIDEAIRCHFELGNVIKIDIKNKNVISVEDNGRGIPTIPDNKGNPMFVTALTNVQAGSNFRDDENNNKKGTNGIGSSMAFILSESANCTTKTANTLGILKTKNNTREIEFNITNKNHSKTGTLIELTPDFKRFGVENFDEIHQTVLYSYVVNQAVCYPKIKFYFNGELVKASNFKDYIKFYNDNAYNLYESDILDIAVYPTDEYSFTYFINGLNVYDGGDALNYIVSNINTGLKNHAPKKYSKLTPSHFKNRLGYIVIYKNRTNLAWNGQTKQKCNSTYSMLESPKIDWKEITKNLYKEKEIISPIIELFQIQEQYEAKKALKELDVVKNNDELLTDVYFPATKEKKYLVIAEGTCIDENEIILDEFFKPKKLKDCYIGDKVRSSSGKVETIKNMNTTLKKYVNINNIKCGYEHRLFVYCTITKTFDFVKAKDVTKNHKLVKSKINKDSIFSEVLDVGKYDDITKLECNDMIFEGHNFDNFIILRNNEIIRVNITEIKVGDVICSQLFE